MARVVRSLGFPALSQSLQILARTGARPFTVVPRTLVLEPGAVWDSEYVIVSAAQRVVEYARADTLFEQETFEFLANTYSPAMKRPAWMSWMAPQQSGFAFQLADTLSPWWGPRGSVCAWLHQFGAFHASHRTDIEMAARHGAMMLDGLFGLRSQYNGLFWAMVLAMGEGAAEVFGKWVGPGETARLLGILIGSRGADQISIGGLSRAVAALRESPTEEFEQCMAAPIYPMMVRRAEFAAQNLEPVIEKLRAGLGRFS